MFSCVFFDELDVLEQEQLDYDRDEMGLTVPEDEAGSDE